MAIEGDGSMHQQIGMLTAKVDMLLEAVRRSEEKSDVSRASTHRRMDDIADRVSKVETQVNTIGDDVSEMKPTVDEVRAWKQRGIGGLAIVGIGASVITFFLTQYFSSILDWLMKR